jgi:hypothetical protein
MLVVSTLVIAILLCPLRGIGEGSPAYIGQRSDSISTVRDTPLKLTNLNPSGFFPLAPGAVAAAPPLLSLAIIEVVNPEKAAVQILVYLVPSDGGPTPKEKILVGQFGLFPPDHPARFTLRSSDAFQKLSAANSTSRNQVRLLLELKPLSQKRSLPNIELTIAPPEWRTEAGG